MKTLDILGGRLKELRTEKKLRLKDMAEFLKITLRHYQRMEKGEVNVPALTLCALEDYYGVTTDISWAARRSGNKRVSRAGWRIK